MIIAVEIEIEIREGLTGELITLLQEHACEVRRLALTEKKSRSGIYTVNFVYSDEKLFRRLTERLQSGEQYKLLGIINYLDRKLSEGVLEVRGRLEIENTEDFEMNVRGAAMRLEEKINLSKTPELETGVMQSVALLNGFHQRSKSPESSRYQQYAMSELTASVLHRFGGLNGFPLIMEYGEREDLVRFLRSIQKSFSAAVLRLPDEDDPEEICMLRQSVEMPVVVCGYDLQCLSILARVLYLEKKFRLKMPDTSIGFIGLNAAICRAAGIINEKGCLKVLGCDEDERKMMFLEKENGLATTPANVFANSDILCVLSSDFNDSDLSDLRPGVLVISMSGNPETEDRLRALRGCRECSVLQSIDLVRLLPGILTGMRAAGIQSLDTAHMLPLAAFLLEAGIPADEADLFGDFHKELAEMLTSPK